MPPVDHMVGLQYCFVTDECTDMLMEKCDNSVILVQSITMGPREKGNTLKFQFMQEDPAAR